MCELCGPDEERSSHKEYLSIIAGDLRSLSRDIDALACGVIKPHSKEAERITIKAKHIIRYLASDWL